MSSLKKWFRKKLGRSTKSEPVPLPRGPLPFLPIKRPSILTPSPSCEELVPRLDNYGVFGLLPPDIRRDILIEAFGRQRLHLDLTYSHPLVRRSGDSGPSSEPQRHCGLGSELVPDTSLPLGWQWFGCVCHRPAKYTIRGSPDYTCRLWPYSDVCLGPSRCSDTCQEGLRCSRTCVEHVWCVCEVEDWEGRHRRCFLGVMGWLLSCRQAYAEGIDILFTTNTFHLSSLDLQLHLPRLLLHQRLASITSLEMMWEFRGRGSDSYTKGMMPPVWEVPDNETPDSPLHALCRMIPDAFPHVRHLNISLQNWISPPKVNHPSDILEAVERVVLGPIEDMVRVLGPGLDLTVSIQFGCWMSLMQRYAKLHDIRLKGEEDRKGRGQFWKSLGPDDELGYWICSGWDDIVMMNGYYWPCSFWGPSGYGSAV